jgi:hypothetical protein
MRFCPESIMSERQQMRLACRQRPAKDILGNASSRVGHAPARDA